jgi:single-stranded-DNA-specific exonuclease
MKKLDEFKKFVFKKFKTVNVNLNKKKIYLFDAEIAPSALNLDFYDKINLLSPFGSGNAEPRFLIQDVKVLNSKIVGEKHIKSLLLGSDSSTIKTISFNSTETDLSSYLLKKNTKNFNIVGKLSLNEWRGQKNVEFIIDDISVIK